MIIGKFGSKRFEVSASKILTFDGLNLSGSLRTASEDTSVKKPATTVKGPGLIKLGITLKLNAALGVNVQGEIDDWMALQDAGKACPFILCGKAISINKFLLIGCKVSDVTILRLRNKPTLAMADLALDFVEYLPPGVQTSAAGTTGAVGVAGGASQVAANAYSVPSAEEKQDLKRPNVGMGDQRWL